jgi:hypothetical protein
MQRHKVGFREQRVQVWLWLTITERQRLDDIYFFLTPSSDVESETHTVEDDLHAHRLGKHRELAAYMTVSDNPCKQPSASEAFSSQTTYQAFFHALHGSPWLFFATRPYAYPCFDLPIAWKVKSPDR